MPAKQYLRIGPRVLAALVALAQFARGENQSPDAPALPRDLRDALERTAAAMVPVRVEFKEAKYSPGPGIYGGPGTYSSYFDKDRFYQKRVHQQRDPATRTIENSVNEESFDGEIYYLGSTEMKLGDNPAILAKFSATDETDPERHRLSFDCPYLYAAGYSMPEAVIELSNYSFQPLALHLAAVAELKSVTEAGTTVRLVFEIDDPQLLAARKTDLAKREKELKSGLNSPDFVATELEVLRQMQAQVPKRTIELVLDKTKNYALVEREDRTAVGRRILHVANSGWKQHPAVWLPSKAVVRYDFDPWGKSPQSDKAQYTSTLELTKVEFGPDEKVQFALDYREPGSLIIDRTTPEARARKDHQVTYTLAADGSQLHRASQKALAELDRSGRSFFWIGLNLVVIGLILLAMLARHYLRARAL